MYANFSGPHSNHVGLNEASIQHNNFLCIHNYYSMCCDYGTHTLLVCIQGLHTILWHSLTECQVILRVNLEQTAIARKEDTIKTLITSGDLKEEVRGVCRLDTHGIYGML